MQLFEKMCKSNGKYLILISEFFHEGLGGEGGRGSFYKWNLPLILDKIEIQYAAEKNIPFSKISEMPYHHFSSILKFQIPITPTTHYLLQFS